MTFWKAIPTVFCAALIAAAFSPNVKADAWNERTVITFSGPVEIPGVHLAGLGCAARWDLCVQDSGHGGRPSRRPDLKQGRIDSLRHHPGYPKLSAQAYRQNRDHL